MRNLDLFGDAYARLVPNSIQRWERPTHAAGAVLFIDLDVGHFGALAIDAIRSALRTIQPSLVADLRCLVLRSPVVRCGDRIVQSPGVEWDDMSPERLAGVVHEELQHLRFRVPLVAAIEFPVGAPPVIGYSETGDHGDGELLAKCRRVELASYLAWQEGVWEPNAYHYQLPSGDHARSFVRIADIFRDPRAASALATWLHDGITASTVTVVDNGTLSALVHELGLVARLAGRPLLHLVSLDAYPLSAYDVRRRLVGPSVESVDVLAVLSVSSTGRTHQWLVDALEQTAPRQWRAECLLTRRLEDPAADAIPLADVPRGRMPPWLKLNAIDAPISAARCTLCRSSKTAHVVHIDPKSFGAMVLPEPTLVMPDVMDARRNASLWSVYSGAVTTSAPDLERDDAAVATDLGVQLSASEMTRESANRLLRERAMERIRFEPAVLPRSKSLAHDVAARVADLRGLRDSDPDRRVIQRALELLGSSSARTVVIDPNELARIAGGAELVLSVARQLVPTVDRVLVAGDGLSDAIETESDIVLFALGVQTGLTIQHLVIEVQDVFRDRPNKPNVHGVVLHAHPADKRVWHSVRNSFKDDQGRARVLALWLTYVPERSPLGEEFSILELLDETKLSQEGRDAFQQRLAYTNPRQPDRIASPASPFWSPTDIRLRRTSYYGDALSGRFALAAVGAAMQRKRGDAKSAGAPSWLRFDLPNMFRSYFDGVLHASMLRWLTPEEAWWGTDSDCEGLLGELEGRSPNDWQLLLPELLLAAGLGKVPPAGVRRLLTSAADHQARAEWPGEVLAFVELGVATAELSLSPPPSG